jgi:hypothetical protein
MLRLIHTIKNDQTVREGKVTIIKHFDFSKFNPIQLVHRMKFTFVEQPMAMARKAGLRFCSGFLRLKILGQLFGRINSLRRQKPRRKHQYVDWMRV